MSWRELVSDKLMSPAEAVEVVKSGDQVAIAAINCTPFTRSAKPCTTGERN